MKSSMLWKTLLTSGRPRQSCKKDPSKAHHPNFPVLTVVTALLVENCRILVVLVAALLLAESCQTLVVWEATGPLVGSFRILAVLGEMEVRAKGAEEIPECLVKGSWAAKVAAESWEDQQQEGKGLVSVLATAWSGSKAMGILLEQHRPKATPRERANACWAQRVAAAAAGFLSEGTRRAQRLLQRTQ